MPRATIVPRELRELSLLHSIQPSYQDASGKRQHATAEELTATLRALGVEAGSEDELAGALRGRRDELCRRGVEPVTVWWSQGPQLLRLRISEKERDAKIRARLTFESGEAIDLEPAGRDLRRITIGNTGWIDRELRFQVTGIPCGYHVLSLSWNGCECETFLLFAPERAFAQGTDLRMWGLFAPLYGIRSERDWGTGDLTDLAKLIRETVEVGGSGIATLPLYASFLSEPFEPSPYAPVSRLFWNELYLDPTRIVEFGLSSAAQELVASADFQNERARLRGLDLVDYRGAMALRRRVLEILAKEFYRNGSAARRAEYDRFMTESPLAEAYGRFRAARENGRWPGDAPPDGLIELDAAEQQASRYHHYVQWQCAVQLESVSGLARSNGFGLYLDFPLGVHGGGFDAWLQRDAFARGAAVGAPPDGLFTGGQNWGFPPMHPERLRETRYRYLIDVLRASMRYAGVLRFDHVMGLHRLYWIAEGLTAKDGVYVRYRSEEMFAILAIESHRHRTTIVGEDLGTVPAIIRRRMDRHRIRRMYILQYEVGPWNGPRPAPEDTVASLNTHDMPPFAGFWTGDDIDERMQFGHVENPGEERGNRERTRRNLVEALRARSLLDGSEPDLPTVYDASMEFLARSDAEFVLANTEDLWLARESQNLPGTHREHPNWQRKLARPVEDLVRDPDLSGRLRRLETWRRQGRNT